MIDKGRCDDGFVWNPSTRECEWDKSCDVGKYLDYIINCKCRKRLTDELVEKSDEDIDGNGMVYNAILYNFGLNRRVCRTCINHNVRINNNLYRQ